MKERVRTILIHVLVGVVVFAGAIYLFNTQISSQKGNPLSELQNSSYPVMEIKGETANYNAMSAYRSDIDLSLVRSQVTIPDDSGELHLRLHHFDYDITAIQYTLFETDPDDPLEEGTLNQLTDAEEDNVKEGTIAFETDIMQGKSYYLKMAVRLDNNTKVYYYTKLQNGAGEHADDYMAFALDFHEALFDADNKDDLVRYLEPGGESQTSYESVTIHSPVDMVFYGEMDLQQETEPRVRLQELNDTYAVIEIKTMLSSELGSGSVQNYDLTETFKLRYLEERMVLLDYQRNMDAYYNYSFIDSSDNYLGIGMQDSSNVDYVSSDAGEKLCFAVEGQLWYYNYSSSDATKIYSFSSENPADIRNDSEDHGIKILSMDDDGNIVYLVYGYINRGRHEGENGILILRYDAEENCNEEKAFLGSSLPYDSMKTDLEKLAFLNEEDVFTCLLDGDLHKVDLVNKTDSIERSGLTGVSLTASGDRNIIALETAQDVTENREIEMLDLRSEKSVTFSCKKDKRICAVGFLADDFIYGIADASDVSKSDSGAVTFPINKIRIMDIDGKEVKKYTKSGRCILETSVNDNVLEMKFGKKKGNKYVSTGEKDYIRFKEEEETDQVTLATKTSETFGEQLYFQFPDYVYIQIEPDLILSRFLSGEDDHSLMLTKSGDQIQQYTVYASGKNEGVFTNLPEAVTGADEMRGSVIDSSEQVLWECIFDDYAIVNGMDDVTKAKDDSGSLAACLSMIADLEGTHVSGEEAQEGGSSAAALLARYSGKQTLTLTGCSLDEVLYYISRGSPVLAKLSSSRYVIVMSYNSTNVRYLDPVTGLSTVTDRTALAETLKKAGNIFYTYLS